ncbi:hypothetical protein EBZ37_14405, partial [bacterium]|nr:hypothetical protein [bacterium]
MMETPRKVSASQVEVMGVETPVRSGARSGDQIHSGFSGGTVRVFKGGPAALLMIPFLLLLPILMLGLILMSLIFGGRLK